MKEYNNCYKKYFHFHQGRKKLLQDIKLEKKRHSKLFSRSKR